jgi:hypothetical protein
MGWNPTTSERSFHFLSLTSIQWAVIPKNEPFVLSAVHPSAVDEIFPGAAWVSGESKAHLYLLYFYSPVYRLSVSSTTFQIRCGYEPQDHVYLVSHFVLFLAASR